MTGLRCAVCPAPAALVIQSAALEDGHLDLPDGGELRCLVVCASHELCARAWVLAVGPVRVTPMLTRSDVDEPPSKPPGREPVLVGDVLDGLLTRQP